MPTQDPNPAINDAETLAEDCRLARERAKGFCIWAKIQPRAGSLLAVKYRMGCNPSIIVPAGFEALGCYCPNCRRPVKFHEAQAFESAPGIETKAAPLASPEQSG